MRGVLWPVVAAMHVVRCCLLCCLDSRVCWCLLEDGAVREQLHWLLKPHPQLCKAVLPLGTPDRTVQVLLDDEGKLVLICVRSTLP